MNERNSLPGGVKFFDGGFDVVNEENKRHLLMEARKKVKIIDSKNILEKLNFYPIIFIENEFSFYNKF